MSENSNNPIPCRLDPPEREGVLDVNRKTGLSQAEIIRRCLRFSLPKFVSGEVNLLDFGKQEEAKPEEATS